MEKNRRLKAAIFLSMSLGLASYICYDHPYNNYVSINSDESGAIGYYSKGRVFIGDHIYIKSLMGNIRPGDVLIEQGYRATGDESLDPNYKIYSSFLIDDKDDRNTILNLLLWYDEQHSFGFNRSLDSLRVEWTVHNILYELGIEKNRTKDVDLNNDDEEKFSNPVLKRLLK